MMMVVMLIMLMTSKRFPGVSTIRPPPLPLVTDYLAILHCSSRLNLLRNDFIQPSPHHHITIITISPLLSPLLLYH